MERLKSVYLLAFMTLVAVPAVGQQTAPHAPHAGTVAVVGDIEHCGTYPVPTGTTLTVRQAVINAGLVCESVNVTVIRSTQDRPQWTQSFTATSADSGEPVESGDVLVVQSMSPLTAAVRKNAVLRSDAGIFIVGLEQDGIVIGDVLQATNTAPPGDGQLKVICRFSGQTPIARAELYHPIVHGDVISISRSNRNVLKGFGSMLPVVSEWKNSGAKVERDPFIPNTVPSIDRSLTSSQPMFQPFQLPTSQKPSLVLPIQDEGSAAADAVEPDGDGEIPPAPVPALSISRSEDVADAGIVDHTMSFASESMTVAPNAPSEIQLAAVTSPTATAFNLWNLVFMGGLLLAGTLILAGTLKPEPDDNMEFSNTASRTTTSNAERVVTTAASHQKLTESPRPQSFAMAVSQTAESLTKIESAIRTTSAVPATKALVAGHEWFSGDWNGKVVSDELPSQVETSAGDSAAASSGTNHNDVAIEASENAIVGESDTEAETRIVSTVADQPIVISELALSPDEHSPAVSEMKSMKSLSADEQSFSDLEDLLQNRLPIDLCETQLPLRVALFGKPAGPRRLRIDAAHGAIPAPHMNLSSDKRREQPVAAANAAAAHAAATHTQSDVEASGSLDRALHFLQERTES